MRVTGETMIFKNDLGYSTTISNKNQEGTYDKMYLSVQFRKDDEKAGRLSNMTKIDIKNGFMSFYKTTNGMTKVKIIVLDYDILDGNKPVEERGDAFEETSTDGAYDYSDDELPF